MYTTKQTIIVLLIYHLLTITQHFIIINKISVNHTQNQK
jgi:hypothetical protein